MNYRHAFHAGNFADVMKHAVLATLIESLKGKDTAFRIIDTHAGVGVYDLVNGAANRTGEWHKGIGLLWGRTFDATLAALLRPYLDAVTACNGAGGTLLQYPGSPWIARHLFRRQDRLTAVEKHTEDAADLERLFAGDYQVRTIALDGWLALGAFVPPKERRGIVLIDPPFEERDEFLRMVDWFAAAHRKWPTGIYALWYPVKDRVAVERMLRALRDTGVRRLTMAELNVRDPDDNGLHGSGLILCNKPWQFETTLTGLLAGLKPVLAQGPGADWRIEEIAGE